MYTLQQSINFARTFIEYSPLDAGVGSEPAVSMANIVRNTMLSAPLVWPFNRAEDSSVSTISGLQDYVAAITNFAYLEKASLTDVTGAVFEIKDIHNTNALPKAGSTGPSISRPNALSVKSINYGTNVSLRFIGVPDAVYVVNLTYQQLPVPMTSFVVSSVTAGGGTAVFTGVFNTLGSLVPFSPGSVVTMSGFTNAVNNGTFIVQSASGTSITVSSSTVVTETPATPATAINSGWAPIPDTFIDIFNSLFLAEAFQAVDDARGAQYRQRGVAALLSKAEGLTDMQRSAFLEQVFARDAQGLSRQLKTQQGNTARGI